MSSRHTRRASAAGLAAALLSVLACGGRAQHAAPPVAPTTHPSDDAAAGPAPTSGAPPAATIDRVTRPTNDQGDSLGTCPTGWIAMPAGACQRPCRGDADCHGRNRCQKLADQRFCDDRSWE